MSRKRKNWCLVCNTKLTQDNATEEHILPNAIGGRLTTQNAVCKGCNSTTGHRIDAGFCQKLAPLSNMLDVERDRGKNPDLKFRDQNSGRQVRLAAGKDAKFEKNYTVHREGGKIIKLLGTFTSKPNTEPDKQEVLATLRKDHPKLTFSSVELSKSEIAPMMNFSLPGYKHAEDLLAPAKMMLSYARHAGLSVSRDCPLLQFLRGNDNIPPPIIAPLEDVLYVDKSNIHDCRHSLSIFHPYGADSVFCYLDLFSCSDYVGIIEIDRAPFLEYSGFQYDVIDADVVLEEFKWLVREPEIRTWMSAREVPYNRMKSRAQVLDYWFSNRVEIWMRRAVRRGLKAFAAALDRGLSEAAAETIASDEIRERMAGRGWDAEVRLTSNKADGVEH